MAWTPERAAKDHWLKDPRNVIQLWLKDKAYDDAAPAWESFRERTAELADSIAEPQR